MATLVTWQRVQSSFGTSPQAITITAPASGNALVIFAAAGGGPVITGLTDNQSNTHVQDATVGSQYLHSCLNITNAPVTINVSWSGGGSAIATINVFEISGLAAVSPYDTSATTTGFAATREATLTSAQGGSIGVAALNIQSSMDITATGGASRLPASGADTNFAVYVNDLGTAGSETFGATWTTSDNATIWAAIYKASSGSSPVLMGQVCC